MAHRTFFDRHGLPWEVWDVIPEVSDRRSGVERRDGGRTVLDRREGLGHWVGVRRELADGWLCFQNAAEKRRLAPIPPGWERLSEDDLRRLADSARPTGVQSRSV